MDYTRTERKLMDAMSEMDIIDCHEHLPPEKERVETPQDVFTLFSHYTRHDLFSAGMDQKDYDKLFDPKIPLKQRWSSFKPYYNAIRFGSYARAALLTAKMVYGIADINDDTYEELSERISEQNTPGIYRRILVDRCRIRASLTQCGRSDVDPPLVPLLHVPTLANLGGKEQLEKLTQGSDPVKSLDDYLAFCKKTLKKWTEEGVVGVKTMAQYTEPPDRAAALAAFDRIMRGEKIASDSRGFNPLHNYLLHCILDMAAELDLVVAVHAGIWGDFRNLDCKHMLNLAPMHPKTKFDLYHLGMPSVRDAIVIGKNLPNVYLNLCWTHIISQEQTCSGISELLDMVPVNKVLAFGGDFHRPVEKVVGHLYMAQEDFACVFGARIDAGTMSYGDALEILRLWFWKNPLRLYDRLEGRLI